MSKLSPEQRESVLARIASGASYEEAAEWVHATHGVRVSKQAIGKLVNKHRSERSEVSKAVARDYITRKLPADLEAADAKHAQAAELLDKAAAQALDSGTVADFEKYSKAAQVFLKFEALKRETLGLTQPDGAVIEGIIGLTALALAEEEEAARQAAFDDDDDGDGSDVPSVDP